MLAPTYAHMNAQARLFALIYPWLFSSDFLADPAAWWVEPTPRIEHFLSR